MVINLCIHLSSFIHEERYTIAPFCIPPGSVLEVSLLPLHTHIVLLHTFYSFLLLHTVYKTYYGY